MKMGLALKNCDQVIPNLSTVCLEGNERWDTELRLKRRFDIIWDIEIMTFLGGHVRHNLLDLKLWIVRITGGSRNSSTHLHHIQISKLKARQLTEVLVQNFDQFRIQGQSPSDTD